MIDRLIHYALVRKVFINRIENIQRKAIISVLSILKFNFGSNRNNFKFQFGFECFGCNFTFDYEPKNMIKSRFEFLKYKKLKINMVYL